MYWLILFVFLISTGGIFDSFASEEQADPSPSHKNLGLTSEEPNAKDKPFISHLFDPDQWASTFATVLTGGGAYAFRLSIKRNDPDISVLSLIYFVAASCIIGSQLIENADLKRIPKKSRFLQLLYGNKTLGYNYAAVLTGMGVLATIFGQKSKAPVSWMAVPFFGGAAMLALLQNTVNTKKDSSSE